MEIRQLKTFLAVIEWGGVTRAAERLGYAQSSVSAQIRMLEDELGKPLFDRLGKSLQLTDAGMRLKSYAENIIRMHDEAVSVIRSNPLPSGVLKMGSPESLAAFRLPSLVREYKRHFPQVKLLIKPGQCWEMRERVRRGELDLAFVMETGNNMEPAEDLQVETLVEEPMVLVAPPHHPLAREAEVKTEQLADQTFLHTEKGCIYRTLFENHLRKSGIHAKGEEFWSIETIKNCVSSGLGLAYLPEITVKKELTEGKLACLPWKLGEEPVMTKMVHNPKRWASPALCEWIRLVKKFAKAWREAHEE